jgi:hypothetical protein
MVRKLHETQGDSRTLEILSGMNTKIAKLQDVPEQIKALNRRIASLESHPVQKIDSLESPVISGNISNSEESKTMEKEAQEVVLKDRKIAELEAQVAHLESPEHRDNLILEWLSTLDQDSYYALGVRKGYLEEINPEKQPDPVELKDPSPEVILSQEKPDDLTGWAYSKTLNCYVKVEGGIHE